jgi:thiosulfate dehydrogenase
MLWTVFITISVIAGIAFGPFLLPLISDTRKTDMANQQLIAYGKELLINTPYFLGPNGRIAKISNGMSCGNCHLDAGTRSFGNSFFATASTYPKYRARSGTVETVEKRINDCFERSLNGQGLDPGSKEMKALVAYIHSVGNSATPEMRENALIKPPEFLDRPASKEAGKLAYKNKCSGCHGENGQGLFDTNSDKWVNPPIWGENSYNNGAGFYRVSLLAGFIKATMPFGAVNGATQLSNEEAWDIAAYINSMPRPEMQLNDDWPEISQKPFDYPYGPYSDNFTQEEHKYGPFKPILQAQQARVKK